MVAPVRPQHRLPVARRGGQGRNATVGRIDHQRRPVVEVALDDPELVVVAGRRIVGRGLRPLDGGQDELIAEQGVAVVHGLRGGGPEFRELLIGQPLPARPLRRPFERRRVVVAHTPCRSGWPSGCATASSRRPARRPARRMRPWYPLRPAAGRDRASSTHLGSPRTRHSDRRDAQPVIVAGRSDATPPRQDSSPGPEIVRVPGAGGFGVTGLAPGAGNFGVTGLAPDAGGFGVTGLAPDDHRPRRAAA